MKTINHRRTELIDYFQTHNSQCIYRLRVLHGKLNEYLFQSTVRLLRKLKSKRNLVVATAFHGKIYGDNPMYIIEKIHELSPKTQIVWIYSGNDDHGIPAYVHVVRKNSEVIRELARASIMIGNCRCHKFLESRADQLNIDTWHGGLGFKKIGLDAKSFQRKSRTQTLSGFDFIISNSDFLSKAYRSAFRYDGVIWKCGYPIEDALIAGDSERQMVYERYHLSNETRIVLYAPTYRSQYRWHCTMDSKQIVEAFQRRFGGKWEMIVHWHQLMPVEDRKLSGTIDATDISSMQSLVKAADACISDYSSSIFQAVQHHIPCFVYADDYEVYSRAQGLYLDFDEQPFPYALTEEALIDNILRYDAELWEEKWKQYQVRMGHIVTGHSAEDVARVCVDFLNGKPKAEIMKEIPFETEY